MNKEQRFPNGLDLLLVWRGLGGGVQHAAWSPDGRELAVGYSDNHLLVWETRAQEYRLRIDRHRGPVIQVAWSPDGHFLATASEDETIRVWKAQTGEEVWSVDTGPGIVENLAWSLDGNHVSAAVLADAGSHTKLVLETWDSRDGRALGRIEEAYWQGADLAMSSNRRWLVLALQNGVTEVWDLATLEREAILKEDQRSFGAAVAPNGRTLAISHAGGWVQLWDLEDERRLQKFPVEEASVYSLDFSADGLLLATKSGDGMVRFRLCETWNEVAEIHESLGSNTRLDLLFNPELPQLVTFDERDTVVHVWSIDADRIRKGESVSSILFLAAEPRESIYRLRIGEEYREIQECLQRSGNRHRFELFSEWALQFTDLNRALLQRKPRIVHFSGHGTKEGCLAFENKFGSMHPISPRVLSKMFKAFAAHVECVILNACYSQEQARAIARHIPYVIGMKKEIPDQVAIAFSVGFYQTLLEGRSIEESFESGRTQIGGAETQSDAARPQTESLPGDLIPTLVRRRPRSVRKRAKDESILRNVNSEKGAANAQEIYS